MAPRPIIFFSPTYFVDIFVSSFCIANISSSSLLSWLGVQAVQALKVYVCRTNVVHSRRPNALNLDDWKSVGLVDILLTLARIIEIFLSFQVVFRLGSPFLCLPFLSIRTFVVFGSTDRLITLLGCFRCNFISYLFPLRGFL